LAGTPEPGLVVGQEQKIVSQPFLGDEAARLQVLLPDSPNQKPQSPPLPQWKKWS
jgi:hypothetical protein